VLRADAARPIEQRLAVLAAQLRTLLERADPEAAAVEDVFVRADPRAALAIGHARGAVLALLGEREVPVAAYPPATVKRAVAGNGRAAKEQVARMVAAILRVKELDVPLDATDALAVAITHALRAPRAGPAPGPA